VLGSATSARFRAFGAGETVQLGNFRVTAFETPHSPCPRYLGTINEPLRPPARVSAYKEGGNYSFLIEHPERRMLVVTSANFTPGKFRGVAADIIFLAIGTLGKHPAQFTSDYWREVVMATGAKRVIPIHWDNFTRSLKKPLRPLPQPFDDFDETMLRLLKLAARDGVALRLPEAFTPIDLIGADQTAQGHLALRESVVSPGEHVLVVEGGDHRP
jgi:L-ascorbate metabolism protein UlaG (beta-lactamase superfamily)